MDKAEFLELVEGGESGTVEFKLDLGRVEGLARTSAAFANTDGGTILFGVDDDGSLRGLTDAQVEKIGETLEKLSRQLLSLNVRTERVDFDGLSFLVARVPKAPDGVGPLQTASGATWVRDGSVARRLPAGVGTSGDVPVPPPPGRLKLFVAMAFRFEEEPALVDYYWAIDRAVKATGLPVELVRMDLEEGDYEITAEIINRIRESDIVLADFTLGSENVYFEAGVAVGAQKRLIRTARRDTVMPFDVRTWKILFYSNATQLEQELQPKVAAAYREVVAGRGRSGPSG
ncbi:ATP-binding protein [Saccharothrix longispora]|uniref:AlbA family DNA-binding domain-containing protein n=1 Tax=Saccharothrix longispora TaxID=33920 RepID=UPI0028FD8B6A|nr:ATP-binding protein [Saccharothrix longispora]MDU0290162.1 ATP-binding protein [Saccharothrix longispora]